MSEKLAPYRVISVSKKGERPFPIKNPYKSFSFGTDPTCQIRLKDVKDASFAAVHCQVTPIEGKMFLVSHAHTLVNGQPTKGVPVALNNGDMISIGKGAVHVNFRFETVTVDKPVESVPFKDITQQVVVPDTPIKVEKSTDGNLAHSSSSLFETHNGSQDRSRHEDEDSAEDKENNPSGVAKERRATTESERPEADREEAPKSDVVPKSTPAKPLQRKLTYSDAVVPPPQEKKASKKGASSSSSLAVDTELKNYEDDEAQVVSLSSALQEVEEPVEEKKAAKTPKKQAKTPKKNTKAKKTEEKAEEKPVEGDESEDNEASEAAEPVAQPTKGKKKAAKTPKKNAKAKKAEDEKPVEESEASETESKAEEAEPVKETKKKAAKTPKKNTKAKKATKKDESESEKAAEESEDVSEAEAKPEKKAAKTPKKNAKAKKEESEPEKESEAEEESAKETKKTPKKAASKSKKQTKTVEKNESEKEESEAEQSEQEKPEPEFKTPTKKSSKTPSKAYVAKATYDSPKTSPSKSPRPLNISPSKRYQKITHISGSVQHEVYSRWVPKGFDITKDTKQPRQLRNSPERKNTNFLAQKVYPGTAVKSAKKSKKNKKQASAPNSPTKTVKTPAKSKSKSKSKKEKEIKIKVDSHKSKSYGRPVEHFDAPDERTRMEILSMPLVNMIKEQLALMNTWVSFEEIYTYHRAHYAVLNMDALRDIVKELVNEKVVSLSTKSKTKRYCLAGCEPEEPVKEKKAKAAEELPENETDDEESEDEGDLRTDLQHQMMQIWLLVKAAKSDKFPQAFLPFMHRPSKTKYPEYYASVSRVVTMKMILQNIKAGEYETLEDMAKDFRQMFVNFKRFNRPKSDVYRCGALLEKAYKAAMKEAKEAANEKPEEEEGSEHESEEKSESEEREQSSERESDNEDEEEKSERDEESENGSDNEEEKSGSDNEEEASAEESVKESVESDDE